MRTGLAAGIVFDDLIYNETTRATYRRSGRIYPVHRFRFPPSSSRMRRLREDDEEGLLVTCWSRPHSSARRLPASTESFRTPVRLRGDKSGM
ncbi:MAG: hypothetical protein V7642_4656 [Burkholderiales bacterium]